MEDLNNSSIAHTEAEDRRDYRDRHNNEEGSKPYAESSERSRGNYNSNYESRGNYGHDNGSRPRRSYNSDRPYRSYNSSDEGHNRPRYNNQRRPYGQGSSDEGYSRPRYNNQHRSYGQGSSDEGYSRPRYNNQHRSYGQGSYDDGYRPRRNSNYGGDSQYDSPRPRRNYSKDGDVPRYSSYSEKPIRGTKLRPRKNKPQVQQEESGIDKMIKRNPQLNDTAYSDADIVNVPVKDVVRLNKFIANSGICSRREADNFILAGVVTVNGEVLTELGSKVNVNTDDVRFNGERIRGEAKVYIVMNKPKGFVTTASDPHADKTVLDLINGCPARVFPVGRLDKNTTGVLMFTNDGEIAEKLTHPSYDKKKIYQVTLTKPLAQEDYDKIIAGVTLSDGEITADALEYVEENDHRKLGIEIHSGKNRIVRRIFESLGYTVKNLDRVYFAGLTKKGIKRGGWRYLTEGEVNVLKMGAYN